MLHRGFAGFVPGNVGHVNHAVDFRADTDEQAEFGDVADFAFDGGTHRMRFHEQLPRIALRLLEAQGNAALRFIHIQDDHIHLF